MESFFARLDARARQIDSLLCVGLDPHQNDLPANTPVAAREFCLRLIEATKDVALCYKPNAAFFEVFGAEGWQALKAVIDAVPDGIPVILDAKRGDIASTAEAYAKAAFETLGVDAITLSPYLGYDSLTPFLNYAEKGVFLLCKTSNPGSVDLQDLPLGGDFDLMAVFEHIARLANNWGESDNIGLVVGATFPDALRKVRYHAPNAWILAPGVGTQGGDMASALQAGLRADGLGVLVNASRGIARAADPHQAALEMVTSIRKARGSLTPRIYTKPTQFSQAATSLLEGLLTMGCVRFGEFKLKSGLISPIYLDLRLLASYPGWLSQAAAAYRRILMTLSFDRIAGLPYAALPIATAVSLQGCYPLIYPRKEKKEYGTGLDIEGHFIPGETIVVIDDLATTGGSKFEAIQKLQEAHLIVKDVIVLVDRQSGAAEALADAGFRLHAVFKLTDMLDHWQQTERVEIEKINAVRQFLADTATGK